jgi:hypothetical protein
MNSICNHLKLSVFGILIIASQSALATTYYVSPSGNDNNNGTSPSTAWASLTRVNSPNTATKAYTPGDVVLFQGGQVFKGCLSFNNTNVPGTKGSQPGTPGPAGLTLDSYGTGSFTIQATCFGLINGQRSAAVSVTSMNGFSINHATIRGATGQADGTWVGIMITNSPELPVSDAISNFSISNCDIGGFYTVNTAQFGAEIFIGGGYLYNVYVGNNVLHGLNGVSSPDDNGITGLGGLMGITNVTYENNQIYNIGGKPYGPGGQEGNGIQAAQMTGALIQHNLVHDVAYNAINKSSGPAGIWTSNSTNVTIQYNEVYNVKPPASCSQPGVNCGADWDGLDLDLNVSNSTLQYNYTHDNWGAGLLAFTHENWGNNVIRYNISENDAQTTSNNYGGLTVWMDDTSGGYKKSPLYVYNNTIYNPGTSVVLEGNGTNLKGYVANNIFSGFNFDTINAGGIDPSGLVFINNDYNMSSFRFNWYAGTKYVVYASLAAFQVATANYNGFAEDQFSITSNPLFVQPGAGTCKAPLSTCLAGYELMKGSPAVGTGLNLTLPPYNLNVGTQDFFGNTLGESGGSGYDIGAYASANSQTPISVGLLSPSAGANLQVGTWTTLTPGYKGDIVSISFTVNGALVCTATKAPFDCSYKLPSSPGVINVQLLATAVGGNTATATSYFNAVPAVVKDISFSIIAPQDGAVLQPNTWITLSGGKIKGPVQSVTYFINGNQFCQTTQTPFNCPGYKTPASGTVKVTATATDTAGAVYSATPVKFSVSTNGN